MTERRQFLKAGAALAAVGPALARADERPQLWQGHDFGPGPGRRPTGWTRAPSGSSRTRAGTRSPRRRASAGSRPQSRPRPRRLHVGGERPLARRARRARETLEQSVEALAALPFVDVLYIRCDWRDVQSRPGRLDLHPVWAADARRGAPPRPARRASASSSRTRRSSPRSWRCPTSCRPKVPLVTIRSPVAGERRTGSSRATTTRSSSGPSASSTSCWPPSSTAIRSSSSPTS